MTTSPENRAYDGHSAAQCPNFVQKTKKIDEYLKPYTLTEQQMRQLKSIFTEEMQLGFAKNPGRQGSLLMMNTYITRDLDRHQSGSFLSLDLGSTNFRVCHLQFVPGERNDRFHVKYYDIPASYRVGDAAPVSQKTIHFYNDDFLYFPLSFLAVLIDWTQKSLSSDSLQIERYCQ